MQRTRELTIVAQDPRVRHPDGKIVRARVSVPADRLEPGPRGERLRVVDIDASGRSLRAPVDLTDPGAEPRARPWSCLDRFADQPDDELVTSAAFHAQNVYAIAARALAAFELALGRRVGWAFPRHQLYLIPHAVPRLGARYSAQDGAVVFGYRDGARGKRLYACLSHDIVVHEVTHAILDGLRPLLAEPSLPDQLAFHEAFADLVALLSVFSIPELVEAVLGIPDARGRIPAANVAEDALAESALFTVAEQFGEAVSRRRGGALRRSSPLSPEIGGRTTQTSSASIAGAR
jgi:hypothetical protein